MEMVLFIGIQASGKTSFYRERFFRTHVRVNLDMLKTRGREELLINASVQLFFTTESRRARSLNVLFSVSSVAPWLFFELDGFKVEEWSDAR